MPVCLPLSVCLSLCLFVFLPICLSHLSVSVAVFLWLYCLFIFVFFYVLFKSLCECLVYYMYYFCLCFSEEQIFGLPLGVVESLWTSVHFGCNNLLSCHLEWSEFYLELVLTISINELCNSLLIYSLQFSSSSPEGGTQKSFFSGEAPPEVQPLTLLYTIFSEKVPASPQGPTPYPFIYHFFRKGTPFVYLLLEKGTPFIYLLKKTYE